MLAALPLALAAGVVKGAPAEHNTAALARAESCQARLLAWSSSMTDFESGHGSTSTSIYSTDFTLVSYKPDPPTATSLITLCDGHARVVGQWTTHNETGLTHVTRYTNSNPVFVPAPYPTPKPCTIGPVECLLLYSSSSSRWNSMTRANASTQEVVEDPRCETPASPPTSYSTNPNGQQCDNCLIAGRQIRLLYWPVTTVAGPGDLCNDKAETYTGSLTGPPRSIVTEGVTIISPTVGISMGDLSRVDKCGTTVAHTIIPVLPEDVSSVNGARALFTHRPFNFADLNYHCIDAPDEEFVTTGTRTDCYQEVPASAYFFGLANAAGAQWDAPNAFANSTIWPNYRPQVLPPATMTSAIRSLWGPDCYIHPDGIWDPPIALQQVASFALPQIMPGDPTSYTVPPTQVAHPGGPTRPHVPQSTAIKTYTAEAEQEPTAATAAHSAESGHTSQNGEHQHGWAPQSSHGESQDAGDSNSGSVSESGDSDPGHDSDRGGAGYKVVYTTVITYTSRKSADADEPRTDGDAEGPGLIYTSTRTRTTQEDGQEALQTETLTYTSNVFAYGSERLNPDGENTEHVYTTTRVFTSLEGDQNTQSTTVAATEQHSNGENSSEETPTTQPASAIASTGGSSSESTNAGDISSAIRSGLGSGGDSNTTQQIGNGAAALEASVGALMMAVALFCIW